VEKKILGLIPEIHDGTGSRVLDPTEERKSGRYELNVSVDGHVRSEDSSTTEIVAKERVEKQLHTLKRSKSPLGDGQEIVHGSCLI
jgi:hypothetical protein